MRWFVEQLLPGLILSQLTIVIAYAKLYFERKWPYWGRTTEKDDDE